MSGRAYSVVNLRTVTLRGGGSGHWDREGRRWMTLADAQAAGIELGYVRENIGPRVRGMVYIGGYCHTVNTVHEVFVCVETGARDRVSGKFLPRRAVWWEVAEESADDHGRIRKHCTSWTFERRNQPLFMIGEDGTA